MKSTILKTPVPGEVQPAPSDKLTETMRLSAEGLAQTAQATPLPCETPLPEVPKREEEPA
jgi:hypothetical protein